MKTTTLLNRTLFATALIAVSTAVFAAGGGNGPRNPQNAPYPYADSRLEPVSATASLPVSTQKNFADRPVAQGKTRAEVYQELIAAENSGEFARMKATYKGH